MKTFEPEQPWEIGDLVTVTDTETGQDWWCRVAKKEVVSDTETQYTFAMFWEWDALKYIPMTENPLLS